MHTLEVSTPCQQARLIWKKSTQDACLALCKQHISVPQETCEWSEGLFSDWGSPTWNPLIPTGLWHKPMNVGIMKSNVSWSSKGSQRRSYPTFFQMCFTKTLPWERFHGENMVCPIPKKFKNTAYLGLSRRFTMHIIICSEKSYCKETSVNTDLTTHGFFSLHGTH